LTWKGTRRHVGERVYLVHHADAAGPGVDPARPLSSRGVLDVELLAHGAAERHVKPSMIWHSGKLRARQTAEAFWRACNPLSVITAVRGLQPSDSTVLIVEALHERGESPSDIMLVGHFPQLPQLLAHLLSGNKEATPATFPVNGLVALEKPEERWHELFRLRIAEGRLLVEESRWKGD
jgi:phosphohistidine phosphatase